MELIRFLLKSYQEALYWVLAILGGGYVLIVLPFWAIATIFPAPSWTGFFLVIGWIVVLIIFGFATISGYEKYKDAQKYKPRQLG